MTNFIHVDRKEYTWEAVVWQTRPGRGPGVVDFLGGGTPVEAVDRALARYPEALSLSTPEHALDQPVREQVLAGMGPHPLSRLNRAQREAVQFLFERCRNFAGRDKEVKRALVEPDYCGGAWVTLELGLPGDEGTCAELLARHRWYVHVGPRGGYRAGAWMGRGCSLRRRSLRDVAYSFYR